MGKCKDRMKRFSKRAWAHVSRDLMRSAGSLMLGLHNLTEGQVITSLLDSDKREIMVDYIKREGRRMGREIPGRYARTLNEYLYDNVIIDGVSLDDLTDGDVGELGEVPPELEAA